MAILPTSARRATGPARRSCHEAHQNPDVVCRCHRRRRSGDTGVGAVCRVPTRRRRRVAVDTGLARRRHLQPDGDDRRHERAVRPRGQHRSRDHANRDPERKVRHADGLGRPAARPRRPVVPGRHRYRHDGARYRRLQRFPQPGSGGLLHLRTGVCAVGPANQIDNSPGRGQEALDLSVGSNTVMGTNRIFSDARITLLAGEETREEDRDRAPYRCSSSSTSPEVTWRPRPARSRATTRHPPSSTPTQRGVHRHHRPAGVRHGVRRSAPRRDGRLRRRDLDLHARPPGLRRPVHHVHRPCQRDPQDRPERRMPVVHGLHVDDEPEWHAPHL